MGANRALIAAVEYVYDSDGHRRVVRSTPAPGEAWLCCFDAGTRLTEIRRGIDAPEIADDATQADSDAYIAALELINPRRIDGFDLDNVDGRRLERDILGRDVTTIRYDLDLRSRVRQQTVTSPAGLTASTPFQYDLDGRRSRDDRFVYIHDALGRLREVRDANSGVLRLQQEFDPLGRCASPGCGSSRSSLLDGPAGSRGA